MTETNTCPPIVYVLQDDASPHEPMGVYSSKHIAIEAQHALALERGEPGRTYRIFRHRLDYRPVMAGATTLEGRPSDDADSAQEETNSRHMRAINGLMSRVLASEKRQSKTREATADMLDILAKGVDRLREIVTEDDE
jgi:hypothetical protein